MKIGFSPYNSPRSGIGPFFDTTAHEAVNLLDSRNLMGIDCVILWGGADISPMLYGEEKGYFYTGPERPSQRDTFEWELLIQAEEKGIPTIGVCRGLQMQCAFAGGKLVQHVNNHEQGHSITCADGNEFTVTSAHHQMLYLEGIEHELLAWSTNNLSDVYKPNYTLVKEPEAVYFPTIKAFGVQFHPEWQIGTPANTWVNQQIAKKFEQIYEQA